MGRGARPIGAEDLLYGSPESLKATAASGTSILGMLTTEAEVRMIRRLERAGPAAILRALSEVHDDLPLDRLSELSEDFYPGIERLLKNLARHRTEATYLSVPVTADRFDDEWCAFERHALEGFTVHLGDGAILEGSDLEPMGLWAAFDNRGHPGPIARWRCRLLKDGALGDRQAYGTEEAVWAESGEEGRTLTPSEEMLQAALVENLLERSRHQWIDSSGVVNSSPPLRESFLKECLVRLVREKPFTKLSFHALIERSRHLTRIICDTDCSEPDEIFTELAAEFGDEVR